MGQNNVEAQLAVCGGKKRVPRDGKLVQFRGRRIWEMRPGLS